MPAPSFFTLGEAAAEVLARIGQVDDGAANPLLVAEAKAHLNAAQRMLQTETDALHQSRRQLISLASGRRFVDLPAEAIAGQITGAEWVDGDVRTMLACGIDPEARMGSGSPAQYDLTPSIGLTRVDVASAGTGYTNGTQIALVSGGSRLAGGHDPVVSLTVVGGAVTAATVLDSGSEWATAPTLTPPGAGSAAALTVTLGGVQLVELCPAPTRGATLEVRYRAAVVPLYEDEDLLSLDDEAVIGRASWLLATTKGLPCRDSLEKAHVLYLNKLSTRQSPGRTVSLSAWRRDRQPRVIGRGLS